MWVVPAIILIAHFHYSSLGMRNTCAVIAGLLGNPIGTLWAMLTRQEIHRRCYTRVSQVLEDSIAKDVAAVAAACDEYGWCDILDQILPVLRNRQRLPRDNQNNHKSVIRRFNLSTIANQLFRLSKRRPGARRAPGGIAEDSIDPRSCLDPYEQYQFAYTREKLITYRSESNMGTWFAIGGLIAALIGAFVRQWENRETLSGSLAIITLAYHFVPLVQISGSLGAFTFALGPLQAIQKLRRKLKAHSRARASETTFRLSLDAEDIWKRLHPITTQLCRDETERVPDNENFAAALTDWTRTASYLGGNSSWRPQKRIRLENIKSDWAPLQLLVVSVGLVAISYATALTLDYTWPYSEGFGCSCLIWTLIFFAWVLSVALDILICRGGHSFEQLWRRTFYKDVIMSTLVLTAGIIKHIGAVNTCLCLTGSLFGTLEINVWPLAEYQWKLSWTRSPGEAFIGLWLTCSLTYIIQLWGREGRSLLCPSKEERKKLAFRLENMRNYLRRLDGDVLVQEENVSPDLEAQAHPAPGEGSGEEAFNIEMMVVEESE
jgi:hypothetical protein